MKTIVSDKVEVEQKRLVDVTCDVCKKKFDVKEETFEIQEFKFIRIHGGYGSVWGDGDVYEIDICQHCMKEKFGENARLVAEDFPIPEKI